MSQRSVLDESPVFDPSLHRPMMPAGRPSPSSSTNMTFVNLGSASALFSTPSPPVSGGGGLGMAPMSNGGLPPMVPTHLASPAGSSGGGGYAMNPMGSWGFPAAPGSGGGGMGAPALQPPLQPAVLHPQPMGHHPPMGGHPQPGSGMAPMMGMQPMYQPHPHHPNPQAPFSMGGPAGSMPMLPTPLQPTGPGGSGGGPMGALPGWGPAAGQHQQQPVGSYGHPHQQPMGLAYGQPAPLHYASPPTSQLGAGMPGYSPSPPGSASSSTTTPSPGSSSAPGTHMSMSMAMSSSTTPTKPGSLGGYGAGPAMGSNGSPGLTAAAQERMRQQQEQIRAEERLKQQQLQVKLLQEEQQRHLREEQERERIEAEKRKAERERMREEEERKRLEAQREQERQQEVLRAEQMRIAEEVRQAQLRVQQEHELQQQKYQMEQFEQQQKIIQEQLKQQEQLRLERLRFEEEQKREEEAARQQQERVKQEEERKRQELLRQELQRQEEFAQEQRRREEALQEKRRQEQQILEQQERLRQEQARVEQERLQAEQRRNSERMQQEKERLAEEVRQQQERLRLAQEEIQREREKMAVELLREQQRIQEERLRLQAEQERLRQERLERERLEEEARVRHQERMRLHHEQLAHQQEALRQQQQQQMAHLRQQQEQLAGSPSNPSQLGHFQQPVPHPHQQHPLHHPHPQHPLPTPGAQASTWSPFGPTPTAAEERPGETKPRGRSATGGTPLPRPTVAAGAPVHGNGGGSPSSGNGGPHVGAGGSVIVGRQHNPRKQPRRPGSPQPLRAIGADATPAHPDQIKAEAMASYEAYAAEIARKHRVNDRAEIMTADTMFDSSAFEDKLGLYEGRNNEQRSAYYDDSSDEEGGSGSGQRGGDKRSGSFVRDRSQKQGRALISHKTGPAAPTASAGSVSGKRATTAFAALRTGPAGAPRGPQWDKEKEAKSNEPPGHRSMSNDRDFEGRALPQPPERRVTGSTIGPRPLPPLGHSRRRSTGSAAEGDSDDDDDSADGAPSATAGPSSSSSSTPERTEKKSLGLRALVKHHTGALKRSPRGPIYNDPQPGLGASIDSAHALIGELQEAVAHQTHNPASAADAPTGAPGQPRSAPLPRAVRQLPPPPTHTSPPPVSPRGHAMMSGSKSLPPLPSASRPAGATTTTSTTATATNPGGRQLPAKKAPLPPVPRKPLSREEAALVLQTRWRASHARRHYSQIIMRTRVAREIYSSELVYVQSLGVTIDVFLKPLRRAAEQGKPIILPTDIESVFGNLEEIYAYHLQLVSKLEARISRWNADSQIGDTFLDMKQDFIMLYSSYINHYDQALETIVRCRDLKTWRAFIQRCNQHPECGGLSLESFLILPVQRVTRYVILLRDLRQKTPENHVDYAGISAAQTYMDNICYQVNENKRSAENLKKQMDVLTSLQGKMKPKDMVRDLVDQNRVFVKQAVITHFDQDADKRREVCLFVFNDLLLVTKGDIKKDRYQVIAKFTRDDVNLRLEIMADTNDFMGQEIKNAFVLHTPRVSYLFFCISADERNQLFEQIRAIFR